MDNADAKAMHLQYHITALGRLSAQWYVDAATILQRAADFGVDTTEAAKATHKALDAMEDARKAFENLRTEVAKAKTERGDG